MWLLFDPVEEMKTYRIDIYADIDEDDIGKEVKIDVGEIRDLHTGDIFTGKIIIKDLVKLTSTNLDSMEE